MGTTAESPERAPASRPAAAALLALVGVLGMACTDGAGGDGVPGPVDGAAPARAAELVDAACRTLAPDVAAVLRETFGRSVPDETPSPAALRAAAAEVDRLVRAATGRIRDVEVPASERPLVERLARGLEEGAAAVVADPSGLEAIGTGREADPFRGADRLAVGYGASSCALASAPGGGD